MRERDDHDLVVVVREQHEIREPVEHEPAVLSSARFPAWKLVWRLQNPFECLLRDLEELRAEL